MCTCNRHVEHDRYTLYIILCRSTVCVMAFMHVTCVLSSLVMQQAMSVDVVELYYKHTNTAACMCTYSTCVCLHVHTQCMCVLTKVLL